MIKVYVELDSEGTITSYSSCPVSEGNIELHIPEDHDLFKPDTVYKISEIGDIVVDDELKLGEHIERKDKELSKACQDTILAGFTHKIDGELYHFSFDMESQLNFQGAERILSQGLFQSISWTVRHNGEYKRIPISKAIMEQLVYVILIHKDSNIARYREELMPLVYKATTVEEIESITWDYESSPTGGTA